MTTFVVVPTWNARVRLPALRDALAADNPRVIVVDNGSTDGTTDWLRDAVPAWRVLAGSTNGGWAAAVNAGITVARDEGAHAVLLLNDDCRPKSGALDALSAALHADERLGAVTPRLLYENRPDVLNATGLVIDRRRALVRARGDGEPDDGRYADAPWVDAPSGACCLVRTAALDAVGPFDEAAFLYYDDADWGLRAGAAGWRTRYVPAAIAYHDGSAGTADDPARRRYYTVRNRLRFARRHGSPTARSLAWSGAIAALPREAARWATGAPSDSRDAGRAHRRRSAAAYGWAVLDALRARDGRSERFG